jgi:hypothetical protein
MVCLVFLGILVSIPAGACASPLPLGQVASASSTTGQGGAFIPPGFTLKSSNGFTIKLVALRGVLGSSVAFAIVVVSDRTSAVSYSTEATATEDSIEVDLGDLGHIAVSFHATGGTTAESSACDKRHTFHVENGYYEGTIDFNGEEGYTEVEASRAEGDAHMLLDLVCAAESESGSGPGLPGAELRVRGSRKSSLPSLTVVENDPRAPVQLEANASEQRGEISIERTIRMKAPRTAFDYDSRLRTAVLGPPAPFSGKARFRRMGPHKSRWSGNLTVELPGRSDVRLTGGRLRASLFRARLKGSGPLE